MENNVFTFLRKDFEIISIIINMKDLEKKKKTLILGHLRFFVAFQMR